MNKIIHIDALEEKIGNTIKLYSVFMIRSWNDFRVVLVFNNYI